MKGIPTVSKWAASKFPGAVTYGVQNGEPYYKRQFAFPDFRTQPNNTCATYYPETDKNPIAFQTKETFERVEFDGALSVYSRAEDLKVVRRFFPSVELPVFYEQIELYNGGKKSVSPEWKTLARIDLRLTCEGYVYFERSCNTPCRPIEAGERLSLTFLYSARYANGDIPARKRPAR